MRARLAETVCAQAHRSDLDGGAPHPTATKGLSVRNERRPEPGAPADLRAHETGPAAPGENLELAFAVFDMGDTVFDTMVVLDNWRWNCQGCIPSEVDDCGVQGPQ